MIHVSTFSLLSWSAARRLALAAVLIVPLWLVVGWALEWWGR